MNNIRELSTVLRFFLPSSSVVSVRVLFFTILGGVFLCQFMSTMFRAPKNNNKSPRGGQDHYFFFAFFHHSIQSLFFFLPRIIRVTVKEFRLLSLPSLLLSLPPFSAIVPSRVRVYLFYLQAALLLSKFVCL